MFGWDFGRKTSEPVRWATKKLLKIFLKKKLGKLILGEIDLNQLDVQLREGSVQLNDLALDVDYLNEALTGFGPVVIKEGSIASLFVQLPWKGKILQAEVDEVEIVVAFCAKDRCRPGEKSDSSGQAGYSNVHGEACKFGDRVRDGATISGSCDVHEGVKTIASLVKWFLSSFHVKVKRLVIAFEPGIEDDGSTPELQRTLVLRMSEIECGASVSADANLNTDARVESFLGISRLMNFVKFHGGMLELLQLGIFDEQTCTPCTSGSSLSESFSEKCLKSSACPIIKGQKEGISGSLTLSIPWKNGSLDIRRLDADVRIDPVEITLRPNILKWLLHTWETYQVSVEESANTMSSESVNSVYFNSASHWHSSKIFSPSSDKTASLFNGSLPFASVDEQKLVNECLLPDSHFIPDWVPISVRGNDSVNGQELDLGASVDQFFECFDEMRNSQSALGNSGMWNWTRSVFSALSAASSLASGSLLIASEQQHVQTNLKVDVAGISIALFFKDAGQGNCCEPQGDGSCVDPTAHCLGAECKDIRIVVQVCPRELRFEGTVRYIEIADIDECSSTGIQNMLQLQSEVQHILPPAALPKEEHDSASHFPRKIRLLSTRGVSYCQLNRPANLSGESFIGPVAFSLEMPPFVFWVDFCLISVLLELFKEISTSAQVNSKKVRPLSMDKKLKSNPGDEGSTTVGKSCKTELFRCNIYVPTGRVILCFASRTGNDVGRCSPWDRFLALDFFTSSPLSKGKFQDAASVPSSTLLKRYADGKTHSLYFNVANLKVYMVSATCMSSRLSKQAITAPEVLSVGNKDGFFTTVSILWQQDQSTGPWIIDRVKHLFTSEECWDRKKCTGYNFSTVITSKAQEDTSSRMREDILRSSTYVVHVNLFHVSTDLHYSRYADLHSLLERTISDANDEQVSDFKEPSVSQTSILVECESLELVIRPEVRDDIRPSLQSELPGSWHYMKLNIRKLDLLSVSNIGGIGGSSFFWVGHGDGKLWGSIAGASEEEFLLISCCKSTRNRGDGGGSNALSSRSAGLDILHLSDPHSLHDFTSITVGCATLVAVGGRLDWLEAISSFFVLPAARVAKAVDSSQEVEFRTYFFLKLVDVGLSYVPYFRNSGDKGVLSNSFSLLSGAGSGELPVACLLAASSLTLSNKHVGDDLDGDYKIRVQELGLLISSAHDDTGGSYSAEYLHEMGYSKVARLALVEVIFRTHCGNGLIWEVECNKCHIHVETCHDTTTGLMHLAAQLQKLLAPDLEESVVHLQNRWNNVHNVHEGTESSDNLKADGQVVLRLSSQMHAASGDAESRSGVTGLMDEICEDAFNLDTDQIWQWDVSESEVCRPFDENMLEGTSGRGVGTPDHFSSRQFFDGSVPHLGVESSQTSFLKDGCFSELIEEYCLSELRPLSELSIGNRLSPERFKSHGEADLVRGNSGWYTDISLSIVENHVSEASQNGVNQSVDEMRSLHHGAPDDCGQAMGRFHFNNMKVSWKMYAGSDWSVGKQNGDPSKSTHGRDTATCLELSLSGIQFQYDSFPDGGTYASRISLTIQDFYLYDRSNAAPWKLILGYYHSKDRPRETTSKAFRLLMESVRPNPSTPLEEYRLHIALLPMLLHLHQSQLDFLIGFFGAKESSANCSEDFPPSSKTSALMTSYLGGQTIVNEALLPFFQKFDIWPILLRVDYQPQSVDLAALRGGKYVELVNLVPWKGVELQLKPVQALGTYGWGGVCETIVGEWLEDISQNQIHKVLRGLPTIRSLVAVGTGATKLVSLPVESYKKDRKVIKGMQRGTIAFLRSISVEAVGLGVHLAAGVHEILLQAENLVTKVPPSVSGPVQIKPKPSVRRDQPRDAQQGMKKACESLSDGLGKSATALLRTPMKKYQRGESAASALATAVRAVPAAAIAPVSACASAAHYALLGLRNSLDPDHKKESLEKYMGPAQPPDCD